MDIVRKIFCGLGLLAILAFSIKGIIDVFTYKEVKKSRIIEISFDSLKRDTNEVYLLDSSKSIIAYIYFYDENLLRFK